MNNYGMMKEENTTEANFKGNKWVTYLAADSRNIEQSLGQFFAGHIEIGSDFYNHLLEACYDALSEIEKDIVKLKSLLDTYPPVPENHNNMNKQTKKK